MKRDMELVRTLLLLTEDFKGAYFEVADLNTDLDKEALIYNAGLMKEAGLIEGVPLRGSNGKLVQFAITKLTWEGHDFLDSIRDEKLWKKAKDSVMNPAASFTFDILKAWFKTEIMRHLPTV